MLKLLRRIKYFLQQRRVDIDLEQEVEFHRALQAERFERDGLDRVAAHDLSVRTMGNVTLAREDARQVWIGLALDRLWQDFVPDVERLAEGEREPRRSCLLARTSRQHHQWR
jgi:hypothetical protein